ncbi:DNA repair protein Rad7 [Coccidioides immitis RS]|uniref:DNA repair protein Rad7 n=1 Tax=Coccidioides immitis (strain RS) TaxID=246410 RepID=J3K3H7_COCIM|nr:DNA repair protein Rad7 [Coccidioides immitis RS]EAS28740.3 DNA repair protein Rad7 [Coccidioides immitis RS]
MTAGFLQRATEPEGSKKGAGTWPHVAQTQSGGSIARDLPSCCLAGVLKPTRELKFRNTRREVTWPKIQLREGVSCESRDPTGGWARLCQFEMANNNTRPRRNIQGPHSALTDFLASHNISAAAIRDSYQRRVADAAQQNDVESTVDTPEDEEEDSVYEEVEATRKRARRNLATAKANAKKKQKAKRSGDHEDSDDDDDELLETMMYQKRKAVPGQLANCEICSKRFTVTPYSKSGPEGGLLCTQCSKKQTAEEKKAKAKVRKPSKRGRRQNYSNLLDGIAQSGAFSLLETCIKKVADSIHDIDEFGDLPEGLLHRLSQILSKRRVMTPRTLELFLRRDVSSIDIYDCAKLETEDFQKIFAFMPYLERVNLRCAGQFKDSTLEYITSRESHIRELQLDSSNLVSDECWQKFFKTCGHKLESLKLSNLDCSMGDETIEQMVKNCQNLRRLKIKECWRPGNESLKSISTLTGLEHLSLDFMQETDLETLGQLIHNVGPNLRTLSLRGFKNADDRILEAVHQRCKRLNKLRFADNATCTDKGYAHLFTNWQAPPLAFIDLSGARHIDNAVPDGPEEPVGLASEGFKALMEHSGDKIETLNISSCRHVSFDAFASTFDESRTYPKLKELDISFHTKVDDFLVNSIFKCCPALRRLIAFACFNITGAKVPSGVALIGGVNACSSIAIEDGVA